MILFTKSHSHLMRCQTILSMLGELQYLLMLSKDCMQYIAKQFRPRNVSLESRARHRQELPRASQGRSCGQEFSHEGQTILSVLKELRYLLMLSKIACNTLLNNSGHEMSHLSQGQGSDKNCAE